MAEIMSPRTPRFVDPCTYRIRKFFDSSNGLDALRLREGNIRWPCCKIWE